MPTPELIARERIDQLLTENGWVVQDYSRMNLAAVTGVAIRAYLTDVGPADYVLFAGGKAVGVVEAKRVVRRRRIMEKTNHRRGNNAGTGISFPVTCAAAAQLIPPISHRSSDMTLLCSSGPVGFIGVWIYPCCAARVA